ncbi:hypothetical protein AVEN_177223-1 [Araneus ventricosus]|uniref:Uncharacterized protein n=1 Tax=Araneus ventricosus TaxID=182803 RepID=A0A4Y2KVY9_ARAVE|nr:hypothetical protein AVEN_177223-1 [Araneus ventricosus]
MKGPANDSKIVNPFVPSLLHISLVKVALPFLTNFGIGMLDTVFTEIQSGNSTASSESSQENGKVGFSKAKEQSTEIQHGNSTASDESSKENGKVRYNRAKESLLLMPGRLRKLVLEAVHGLSYEVRSWRMDHAFIGKKKRTVHWRSDGTIDRIKTAQQLVLDESLSIRKRFEVACVYCLEESVRTLWTEMEASRQTENIGTADNCAVRFWARWIREGSRVPWTQAAGEYLDLPVQYSTAPIIKFSSLFPLLQPKERQKFLYPFRFATDEDFRISLYIVTKGEEKTILKRDAKKLLVLYLNWPLQSLFLETAEKIWTYIDKYTFYILVNVILLYYKLRKDFDYCELLEKFWNISPNHLRKAARECSHLSKEIDSCLNESRRKRKSNDDRIKEILTKCQIN